MKHKITIHLDREDLDKVEREAEAAGWTAAMWVEWLVHDYQPPEEVERDGD